MTTLTPNYGWSMPDPGGSPNTWGDTLNQTTGKIDQQVKVNELAGVPIGAGALWFGATPPANWILLQGQTLLRSGTYAALFAIFGTTYNVGTVAADSFMLPDLQQKFPFGAKPAAGNALGQITGAFAVTLAIANMPAHQHPITDVTHTHGVNQAPHTHSDPGHTHAASEAAHSHTINGQVLTPQAGVNVQSGSGWQFGAANSVSTSSVQPAITVSPAVTNLGSAQPAINLVAGGTNLSHTENTGSGTPFNVIPPLLGINFMIKYQ
jgi:microcystin-dependent protein